MIETNDAHAIVPRLEAFLFMHGEPVDLAKVAKALGVDRRMASEAVEFLRGELEGRVAGRTYARRRGDAFHHCVRRAGKPERNRICTGSEFHLYSADAPHAGSR